MRVTESSFAFTVRAGGTARRRNRGAVTMDPCRTLRRATLPVMPPRRSPARCSRPAADARSPPRPCCPAAEGMRPVCVNAACSAVVSPQLSLLATVRFMPSGITVNCGSASPPARCTPCQRRPDRPDQQLLRPIANDEKAGCQHLFIGAGKSARRHGDELYRRSGAFGVVYFRQRDSRRGRAARSDGHRVEVVAGCVWRRQRHQHGGVLRALDQKGTRPRPSSRRVVRPSCRSCPCPSRRSKPPASIRLTESLAAGGHLRCWAHQNPFGGGPPSVGPTPRITSCFFPTPRNEIPGVSALAPAPAIPRVDRLPNRLWPAAIVRIAMSESTVPLLLPTVTE